MRCSLPVLAALTLFAMPLAAETRTLRPDDVYNLKDVDDPQLSPDGRIVAYTVEGAEREEDKTNADVWMAALDGSGELRLTSHKESETRPRFSPDGRSLAFLSKRDGKKTQVWLLDRRGGEPQRLTDYKASVSALAFSPDGKRLALVVSDPDPDEPPEDEAKKPKHPKPIVIRRLQFKRDGEGYLRELRSHIHVFDLETKASVPVTSGPYDDSAPAWSPDGSLIAFVSNRTQEPDANVNSDVFVVEPTAGATPRQLTTSPGTDSAPAWSADGKWIAYVAGCDPRDLWYGASHLALVPAAGGASRPLTQALDRNVLSPAFSPDGRHVLFLLEDGGNQHLARVPSEGGAPERVVAGERHVAAFDLGPAGELVVLESRPQQPAEVSSLGKDGALARLSHANDALLAGLRLASVERFKAKSRDGTPVDGFLVRPPDAPLGKKLPTLLWIHGGPTEQYSTEFQLRWQMLAAAGYAVVAANPRGSTGYGSAFSRAIWADWGNKDFDDVMAALDHAITQGVADPERLGVGGWSYGGILTNYVITKTARFKAAVSGASEANYLADYGTDHYQYWWETELGLPWKNRELWIRLSPWFQVERVKTPTLVLCGEADMNVPLLNSEQLYQALRRLGVATELVIYPGEDHDIDTPSYAKDRFERYLAWFDRWLKAR